MSHNAPEDSSVDGAPILPDVDHQTLLSSNSPIPHDLVFEVGGHQVLGHRQYLALFSSYLRTFLYGPFLPAETDNGIAVVRVFDFSVAAIQNMIGFIYSSLDHSKYNLFDNQSEVTDQDEMQVALETYRAADFFHIPGLMSLCGEAIGRIRVTRTNFEWLESFLQAGILEEQLNQSVLLIKKYVEELDKRRSGDKSHLDQELKDKSDEWINHEIECNDCSEVELTGAGFHQDGVYQKKGSYNGRPTYVMENDRYWRMYPFVFWISLLYYTGTHWLVVNKKSTTRYNMYKKLYENLNEDSYIVKFEDSSYHNGPPVYGHPVNGISLKCGTRPICQKVAVTGHADLEGIYSAQNSYQLGVKTFKHGHKEIWMTEDGFMINLARIDRDEHRDAPKKMCPCQANNWRYMSETLIVTCSSVNCSCQYHN